MDSLIRSSLKTMVALEDRYGLSVSLGTFDPRVPDGVVIEHVTADRTHAMVLKAGLRLILHAGAPGKAYLAHLPQDELEDVLGRMELTRFTGNTITRPCTSANSSPGDCRPLQKNTVTPASRTIAVRCPIGL
jgi:DNA-binding IclR family transcriptional regulator